MPYYLYKAYPTFATELTSDFNIGDSTMVVEESSDDIIPPATEADPQLLTLFDDDEHLLETIEYTHKDEGTNTISGITRAVEGNELDWDSGTRVGRYHTAEEHDRICDNLNAIYTGTTVDSIHVSNFLVLPVGLDKYAPE